MSTLLIGIGCFFLGVGCGILVLHFFTRQKYLVRTTIKVKPKLVPVATEQAQIAYPRRYQGVAQVYGKEVKFWITEEDYLKLSNKPDTVVSLEWVESLIWKSDPVLV